MTSTNIKLIQQTLEDFTGESPTEKTEYGTPFGKEKLSARHQELRMEAPPRPTERPTEDR